ncbi:MAG: D-alanine--D-alanine ligase [Flavobacteriales bacterium]|nr:D-alanine--D-alanine ligase [Flavobacteriales bacterium]
MLNIAVIEGGYSHEKVISLKSSETVFQNLDRDNYHPVKVRIDDAGWYAFYNDEQVEVDRSNFSIPGLRFDFAFIMIHGTPGEDGKLQAYFDMIGMPYSTCSHLASTLTFNKFVCNQYLRNFGVKVADAVLVRKNQQIDVAGIISRVGLPCFVKPADGGSSFGVTKVKAEQELEAAVRLALEHGTQAVIERFMQGREVTNGVFKGREGVKVLPITEIVTRNEFFDFDAKYKGESEEITPADLTPELEQQVKKQTKRIYELLDLDGICRADYIVQGDEPYLIEINTVPGMSAESLIPQMAAYEGIPLKALLSEIIEVNS